MKSSRHPLPWDPSATPPPQSVAIAVVILTKNEAANIRRCVESAGWAEQVVVVDSGSTDSTAGIAREAGAEVVETDWPGYSEQRQRVLSLSSVRHDWILWIDADEYASSELANEVARCLENPEHNAYLVRMQLRFQGQWIDHCGWSQSRQMRLVKRLATRYPPASVSEWPVIEGTSGRLESFIVDDDRKGLESWLIKHVNYASLEAGSLAAGPKPSLRERLSAFRASRGDDARPVGRAIAKDLILPTVPFKPVILFFYMYVWRLGFLDGLWGLRFCVYHATHRMTVSALVHQVRPCETP